MFRKKAFTLIELLVVVSIIALLVSILMPALGRARAQAKKVMCMSNQHSLFLGLSMYSDDSNGGLPLSVHGKTSMADVPAGGWWYTLSDGDTPKLSGFQAGITGALEFWQQTSANYLDEQWNVFECPSGPRKSPTDTGTREAKYAGNYGCNTNIMVRPYVASTSIKLTTVRRPAGIAMFFDSGGFDMWQQQAKYPNGYYWYVPGYWNNANGSNNQYDFQSIFEKDVIERHPNKTVNVVWCDGHSSGLKADDFVDGDSYWNWR